MSCIGLVREHVDGLPDEAIFATRDLVKYGRRNTVDQSTHQLVKQGVITRIAQGVFVKAGASRPSDMAIAIYKARSFGRELVRHGKEIAAEWLARTNNNSGPTPTPPEDSPVILQIRGRTSAFWSDNRRIFLHGTCDRKVYGGESTVAQLTRSLWYLGREVGDTELQNKIQSTPIDELIQVIEHAQWMPAWLSDTVRLTCYG